jgi:peptide/nickel transport system ATP-binding protein
MCQQVIVMYAGHIVEYADVLSIFKDPLHPYTVGLLKSLPTKDRKRLEQVEGQPPSIHALPQGCYFEPRCPRRMEECKHVSPELLALEDGRKVRCILYNKATNY